MLLVDESDEESDEEPIMDEYVFDILIRIAF